MAPLFYPIKNGEVVVQCIVFSSFSVCETRSRMLNETTAYPIQETFQIRTYIDISHLHFVITMHIFIQFITMLVRRVHL